MHASNRTSVVTASSKRILKCSYVHPPGPEDDPRGALFKLSKNFCRSNFTGDSGVQLRTFSGIGWTTSWRRWFCTSAGTSVTGKLQKETNTNQAKLSSLFQRAHIENRENILPTVPSRFRKVARPPSNLSRKVERCVEKPFTSHPRPVASGSPLHAPAPDSTRNIFTLALSNKDKIHLSSRVLAEIRETDSCLVSSRNCFTARCQPIDHLLHYAQQTWALA